jgi:hypothetical protein
MLSREVIAIDPAQFDLAFVDRQSIAGADSVQLVMALNNAGVPCVGISAMASSNETLKPFTRLALNKAVVVGALHCGRLVVEQVNALDPDSVAELLLFEENLLRPSTPEMADLHEKTEELIKLHLKSSL